MDGNTLALIIGIIGIFAILVLVAFWRYRGNIEIDLASPWAKLGIKGKNTRRNTRPSSPSSITPAQPGARIADVEAGKDIRAKATGGSATVERAKAKGSITATSDNPPDPKA